MAVELSEIIDQTAAKLIADLAVTHPGVEFTYSVIGAGGLHAILIQTPFAEYAFGGAQTVVDDEPQFTMAMADCVQTDHETVFHDHWPLCCEHHHSLVPDLRDGQPVWACSRAGPAVPIGQLATLQ